MGTLSPQAVVEGTQRESEVTVNYHSEFGLGDLFLMSRNISCPSLLCQSKVTLATRILNHSSRHGQFSEILHGSKTVFRAALKNCEITSQTKSLSLETEQRLWVVMLIMVLTL